MWMVLALVACKNHVPKLDGLDVTSADAARSMIEDMVAAHGGDFAKRGDLQITMQDTWVRKGFAPPYPDHERIVLTFNNDLDKSLMVFEGSDVRWGHDSVEGWNSAGGERTYAHVEEASFSVPTTAYFYSLPFRFLDDGVIYRDVGDITEEGRTLNQVAISFESGVGEVTDRYLVRIDTSTNRLVDAAFTVYDNGALPQAIARYEDYQQYDGIWLPSLIDIEILRPGVLSGDLHRFELESAQLLTDFDRWQYEKPGTPRPPPAPERPIVPVEPIEPVAPVAPVQPADLSALSGSDSEPACPNCGEGLTCCYDGMGRGRCQATCAKQPTVDRSTCSSDDECPDGQTCNYGGPVGSGRHCSDPNVPVY